MGFILQNIELIKVATDVSLILALLFLGYRICRSPRSAATIQQVGQLETSLRMLMKEADTASRGLNDQLLKRQQSLEKLLSDIESVDQSIVKSISNVDAKKTEIESLVREATRAGDQLTKNHSRQIIETAPAMPALSQAPLEGRILDSSPIAEPESFGKRIAQPTPKKAQTNIYGEPLGVEPAQRAAIQPVPAKAPVRKATQRYMQSLARKVEREVSDAALAEPDLTSSIQEVYTAAEKLLKAGREPEFVAQATNLPLEEVEALQRLAGAQEAASAQPVVTTSVAQEDPRLGVLGGIKRQVQVL